MDAERQRNSGSPSSRPGASVNQPQCPRRPLRGDRLGLALVLLGLASPASAGTVVQLFNGNSSKCIDTGGPGAAWGKNLALSTCQIGNANQQFNVLGNSDGSVTFQNVSSSLCLDVPGASTAPNTKLQQWTCNWGPAQRFAANRMSDGQYYFVNPNSGLLLDLTGGGKTDGTLLQLYGRNGSPAQSFNVWLLSGSFPPQAGGGSNGGGAQARTTFSYLDSIGVNAHLNWGSYTNFGVVQNAISYLGVHHARVPVPRSDLMGTYQTLASQNGLKYLVVAGTDEWKTYSPYADLPMMDTLQKSSGSIEAYEGPNEYSGHNYIFNGQSSLNNWPWSWAVNSNAASAIHGDANLGGVKYVAASQKNGTDANIASEGNQAWTLDAGNWHTYFGNGQEPYGNIAYGHTNALVTAPGRPVYLTELGCSTYDGSGGWGACAGNSAAYTLKMVADAFLVGVTRSYFYEMLNDNVGSPAANDIEANFGLFNGSGNPKWSAIGLHNQNQILGDGGGNASYFNPGQLGFSISGLPTDNGHTLLLQKSNGNFELLVWTEQAAGANVTVNFTQSHGTVSVYDPTMGTSPSKTAYNQSSVGFSIYDSLMIVEIQN